MFGGIEVLLETCPLFCNTVKVGFVKGVVSVGLMYELTGLYGPGFLVGSFTCSLSRLPGFDLWKSLPNGLYLVLEGAIKDLLKCSIGILLSEEIIISFGSFGTICSGKGTPDKNGRNTELGWGGNEDIGGGISNG